MQFQPDDEAGAFVKEAQKLMQ
jgi:TRAF3-interacting protein 1